MPSPIVGIATGLGDAISQYVGQKNETQNQMQIQTAKADIESAHTEQQQQAELDRQQALADYKNKLNTAPTSNVDPDTAEKLLPGSGKDLVTKFQQTNNRLPTLDEVSKFGTMAKDLAPSDSPNAKQQDALEKQYADRLQKVVSFRSGGLGLQDSKVDQAIDLRTLMNQYYDPKTDTYNVPPAQHSEIALGLARLVSPQGTVPIELEKQIRQSTGREALAQALIYAGADPAQVGGPTQSVVKMFKDSIDRQGNTAERLRDQYINGLKGLKPTSLSQDRVDRLNKAELTSSYSDFLKKSPDQQKNHLEPAVAQHPIGKVTVVSPSGVRGTIPAEQLDEALKSGYKQAQ